METTDFLKLGAWCLERLSLKHQRELLSLAENNSPFSDTVLAGLRDIDRGEEFISESGGSLDIFTFMDILACCDQPSIDRLVNDGRLKRLLLQSEQTGGYLVLDNEAVYYTYDMDNTVHWFNRVLGWPGLVEERDDSGYGLYGLVVPRLDTHVATNRGPYLQLMRGDPTLDTVAFIKVWGLDGLRQRILDHGWIEVTPIEKTGWGARLFALTTCDGSLIRFHEPDELGK